MTEGTAAPYLALLPVVVVKQGTGLQRGDLHLGPAGGLVPDIQQVLLLRAKLAAELPVQGLVTGNDRLPAEGTRRQIQPVSSKQPLQPLIDRQVINRMMIFLL